MEIADKIILSTMVLVLAICAIVAIYTIVSEIIGYFKERREFKRTMELSRTIHRPQGGELKMKVKPGFTVNKPKEVT